MSSMENKLISVVLHPFVRLDVAVSKVKFAENLHFVLSSPDEIAFILTSCVLICFLEC